jgi:AraC-like DNA-binding protein
VINENLGSNFYNLINKYRINEAQGLILSPEKSKLKLEAIAYDVGFKSKSTFNEAFKRNTGLTPSQFRKNALRS